MTVQALIPLNHFAKSRDLSRFFFKFNVTFKLNLAHLASVILKLWNHDLFVIVDIF